MFTTKPIRYLREPMDGSKIPYWNVIQKWSNILFKPQETVNETLDIRTLSLIVNKYKDNTSIISLCKHARDSAAYIDVSRNFNEDLSFKEFINLKELLTLSFSYNRVVIFDEDIGTGFLVNFVKNYYELVRGKEVIIETTLRFNETEELLDLKDFLYAYNDSAGLVVNRYRKSYASSPEILMKFASVKKEYTSLISTMFWVMSYHSLESLGKKSLAKDCVTALQELGFDTNTLSPFTSAFDFDNYLSNIFQIYGGHSK